MSPSIPGREAGPFGPEDFDAAITSSIRKIMHAASVAALIICSFAARGSIDVLGLDLQPQVQSVLYCLD